MTAIGWAIFVDSPSFNRTLPSRFRENHVVAPPRQWISVWWMPRKRRPRQVQNCRGSVSKRGRFVGLTSLPRPWEEAATPIQPLPNSFGVQPPRILHHDPSEKNKTNQTFCIEKMHSQLGRPLFCPARFGSPQASHLRSDLSE